MSTRLPTEVTRLKRGNARSQSRALQPRGQSGGKPRGQSGGKAKSSALLLLKLQLSFQCPETNSLVLNNVDHRSKVSTIKGRLEQEVGILPDMYYLSYLDNVPMEDSSRLSDHDVVNRGTLRINVWRLWQDLLKAAFLGNIKDCFDCSLNICGVSEWNRYCAWVTLFVAAHHGHHNLVAELLKRTTLPINSTSPCRWTALHAAARMGRWKVVCMLVANGVDVRVADVQDTTAHDLAHTYGHRKCENSLAFCQWNLQKYRTVQERKLDYDALHERQLATRLAHQLVDSSLKMNYSGMRGQLYSAQLENPVTMAKVKKFQEERASNPFAKDILRMKMEEDLSCRDTNGKLDFNYGWFDEVRAQQLIPSTQDIIKYSDPSSCELRPRSLLNPGGFKVQLYTPPPAPATPSFPSVCSSPTSSLAAGVRKHSTPHTRAQTKHSRSHIVRIKEVGGAGAPVDLRTPKLEITHAF